VIEQKHTSVEADQDAGYRIMSFFYNDRDGLACVVLQGLGQLPLPKGQRAGLAPEQKVSTQ